MADEFFLSRWSRRKTLARRGEPVPEPKPAETAVPPAAAGSAAATAQPPGAAPVEPPPLPPVESLTPDSDFSPFMHAEVDPNLRRQALRTLFQDPRFNVMDGLDVYIDDYSQPDPIPAEWMGKLNQMARLGDYQEPVPEEGREGAEGGQESMPTPADEAQPQPADDVAAAARSDTADAGDGPTEVDDSSHEGLGR